MSKQATACRRPQLPERERAQQRGQLAAGDTFVDMRIPAGKAERANAWAEVDKRLTELAPAVDWVWDKTPLIRSENVNAVPSAYLGQWDLSFTSIK